MWILPKYFVYSCIIKLIFVNFFLLQLLANQIVVQRWILTRDIIKELQLHSVTSCVTECWETEKCIAVGFHKDPNVSHNKICLLLKQLRLKNKNGTRINVFALLDVSF